MTDFSQDPDTVLAANLEEGYVGLRIQQGVPLLDRDLNLLQDLVAATVRSIVSRYLGSGVAVGGSDDRPKRSDAFLIAAADADNDFMIKAGPPGRCLVDGIEVTIAADLAYSAQSLEEPDELAPPAAGTRDDTVYLDAFLVTAEKGAVMDNHDDVVVQTSVRLKPAWVVRVAPGGALPDPVPGHGHLPLARITRAAGQPRITAGAIVDLRALCFPLSTVRRMTLAPILWHVPPDPRQPGEEVTLDGQNFQFFDDDVVEVGFRGPGVDGEQVVQVKDAALKPTSLRFAVPVFAPELEAETELTLTVRTPYGTALTTITIVPN